MSCARRSIQRPYPRLETTVVAFRPALKASGHLQTRSDGPIQSLRLSLVSRHVSIVSCRDPVLQERGHREGLESRTCPSPRAPPGNRLEKLVGDRAGQHSIRVNDQYRIRFVWTDTGPTDVEITDYH